MRPLLAALLLLPLLCTAEPATLIRAAELKSEPASDAATIAQLAENASVDAVERRGGWTRVKASGAEGWVKMLSLRYGAGAKPGDSGLSQVFNVARTGSSGTQVTTGVRGLDEQQLANAQPNARELARLNGFAADRTAAEGFAAEGRLSPTAVEYPK
jgi:hypothetical protein